MLDQIIRQQDKMSADIGEIRESMGAWVEATHSMKNALQVLVPLPARVEALEKAQTVANQEKIAERAEKAGMLKLVGVAKVLIPWVWAGIVGAIAWLWGRSSG